MSNWKPCSEVEKKIVLSIHKKPKFISSISKELNISLQTISKTIERMGEHDLISRNKDYVKDSRKTTISLNKKRIKIEKTNSFYWIYFILSFVPLIVSLILSLIFKRYFLVVGCIVEVIPPLLFMIYQAYIKGDKVIVEKNPKTKKLTKEVEEKKVDNDYQEIDNT